MRIGRFMLLLLSGCATATDGRSTPASQPASAPASQPASAPASQPSSRAAPTEDAGRIPADWVEGRAAEASARLEATPAGRLIARAIEAHGGLRTWLSAGTIAFTFDYQPLEQPQRRMNTRSRVDLWRSRAVQKEMGEGADARLGWNGRQSWIVPNAAAFPTPARFWATTPYYFVGMPFVLADPGVRFEQLADAELDGQSYNLVKATFEPGTGDSPDDYYILYLHPETAHLAALRYIVAYPGFFKDGGHTPEKLMRYGEQKTVQGLRFAHRLDTFSWGEAGIGPRVTEITVADITLGETISAAAFDPEPGAEVSDSM